MEHVIKKKGFKCTAHLFAHRKTGAKHRFQQEYDELAQKVRIAWTRDLIQMQVAFDKMRPSNMALAQNRLDYQKKQAENEARNSMQDIFKRYRVEISRIVNELGGYPQEDGYVCFADGSKAKMSTGLYIPKEKLLCLSNELPPSNEPDAITAA